MNALASARRRAAETFRRHGLPSAKVEAWKFTPLNNAPLHTLAPAGPAEADIAPHILPGTGGLAVFINGRFRADLSRLPDGCATFAAVSEDEAAALLDDGDSRADAVAAFNGSAAQDGAVLRFARSLDAPVQILCLSVGPAATVNLRHAIQVADGVSATVVETWRGGGAVWSNAVTRVALGRGARLAHHVLQGEGPEAWHTGRIHADLEDGATYANCTLSVGAATGRREVLIRFDGPECRAELTGLNLGRGHQHLDYFSRIEHAMPDGRSDQLVKAAVRDRAHSIFQGRISVAEDAQRTDAQQLARALLLSDGAAATAKPELEILADDVKCSHGATVGDLDAHSLFYLRARGIGPDEAHALLVESFLAEAVERIADPMVRAVFAAEVAAWTRS